MIFLPSINIKAINCFDEAIDLNPRSERAWNFKGYALYRLGDMTQPSRVSILPSILASNMQMHGTTKAVLYFKSVDMKKQLRHIVIYKR